MHRVPLEHRAARVAAQGSVGEVTFAPRGRLQAASGNMLTTAAVAGQGITQIFEYHVAEQLSNGELEILLPSLEPTPAWCTPSTRSRRRSCRR